MTAEVAILNSGAVAIAADSAVTIGHGKKIYNSALKVFSLSKFSPVGIMIYGNAGLLGVPWETIIKTYRSQLKYQSFPTLEEYADDFLDYLARQNDFFPPNIRLDWHKATVCNYFLGIRKILENQVYDRFVNNESIDQSRINEILKSIINERHKELSSLPLIQGISEEWEASFREKLQAHLDELVLQVFQKMPISNEEKNYLLDIATWIYCREIFSNGYSGIVICGFGDKEIYPSIVTNLIDGVFDNKLKFKKDAAKSYKVMNGNDCFICPFAQGDMIASFMEGQNPAVSNFTEQWLNRIFSHLPTLIPDAILNGDDAHKEEFKKNFSRSTIELLKDFFQRLDAHKKEEHIDPIVNMVRVLPKDELAAMAESLVNLTAFKKRMSDVLETVGGPVDVAVISKGDGFIWVKRKHYFEPQLNQQFFANYFRGASHEEDK